MTINVSDYLTEDEKKQIAIDCFRAECVKRSSADFERIITNSAYDVVWRQMDEFCDKSVIAKLKDKVRSIIEDLTVFDIFRKPDAWGREANTPYKVIVDCVMENKSLVNAKVEKAISQLPNKDMRPIVIEAVRNSIK